MICLWVFRPAEFAAWRELVASPDVSTYNEYVTLLASIQADCERSGYTVQRVAMTVAEMRAELSRLGLENTPENRAKVIASQAKA